MKTLFKHGWLALMLLVLPTSTHAADRAKRVAELKQLRAVLPPSRAFDEWLKTTGYLPPDFATLPSVPYPQDLLTVMHHGKPHRVTAAEWPARRKQLAALVQEYLLGHAPPPPGNVRGVIESKKQEEGHLTWTVRLEFGPHHAAKLHCRLWLPLHLPTKPLPVFLVDNFNYTSFARDALDRGRFLICVYNATDPVYRADHKDESATYQNLFGHYDWSEFRRRGWSASRAVDWLRTLPFVNRDQIYIGGHSRSAKQALAAAAFDARIAGVIASSPGSGGSLEFRYCDQYYYCESAERLTTVFPRWVSPKVRCFAGRENKLPADMHFVYALIAPRPVLMSTAINDSVESTWAVEQMYQSIAPVWKLLGKPGNLALRYRPGQHHPDAATCSAHSRFLVLCSEGKSPAAAFPYRPYHPWNYATWARRHPPPPPPLARAETPAQTRELLHWLLGSGPSYTSAHVTLGQGETAQAARVLNRLKPPHLKCRFDDVNGDFYYPPNVHWSVPTRVGQGTQSARSNQASVIRSSGERGNAVHPQSAEADSSKEASARKLPTIIWLAPLHCSTGYNPDFYRTGDVPYLRFARAGFLVFCFDPIATGARQAERRTFYQRHPRWSLMGKMVLDARHAIDAVLANPDADPHRIYLVGFGMGGMVATFTAALDGRVAAAVSSSGFTPFRTDTDAAGTGGIRRWSHLYGWLPRLGPFVGHEAAVPVDFPDILGAFAPHRMLVIAPTLDWHNPAARVAQAVEAARSTYEAQGMGNRLQLWRPVCLAEFNNAIESRIIRFLQ